MFKRLIDAAMLRSEVYRAMKADRNLTREALIVVIIIAVINGVLGFLGNLIWSLFTGSGIGSTLLGLVWSVIWVIVGYFLYAYLAYWIGVQFFQGKATFEEMRRSLGYAYAPMIFSSIPCIGILASIWVLVTGVIAIRETHATNTNNAIIIAVICIVIHFVIFFTVGSLISVGSASLSLLSGGNTPVIHPRPFRP